MNDFLPPGFIPEQHADNGPPTVVSFDQINSTDAVQAWADLLQEECDAAELNVLQSETIRRIAKGRFR